MASGLNLDTGHSIEEMIVKPFKYSELPYNSVGAASIRMAYDMNNCRKIDGVDWRIVVGDNRGVSGGKEEFLEYVEDMRKFLEEYDEYLRKRHEEYREFLKNKIL